MSYLSDIFNIDGVGFGKSIPFSNIFINLTNVFISSIKSKISFLHV